jgi:hypothetical protein
MKIEEDYNPICLRQEEFPRENQNTQDSVKNQLPCED